MEPKMPWRAMIADTLRKQIAGDWSKRPGMVFPTIFSKRGVLKYTWGGVGVHRKLTTFCQSYH